MMGAMKAIVLAAAAWLAGAAGQDAAPKAEGGNDFLILHDRTTLRGEIVGYSAAGKLSVRTAASDRPFEVGLEEVSRLRFSSEESRPGTPAGEQARLAGGGTLVGKIASFQGDTAVLESAAGPLRLGRRDVKALLLNAPESPLPVLRDDKKDILIREVEKKPEGGEKPGRECVAEYGRLKAIGAKVVFETTVPADKDAKERTEDREFDRASVKHVYLHRDTAPGDFPPGLFGKVTLRAGDRWVAVLQGMTRDRVRLFSHLFGTVEIDKSKVHSISFIQQAQLTAGNILITDQTGIHEFDAQRQEIWTYTADRINVIPDRAEREAEIMLAPDKQAFFLAIRQQVGEGHDQFNDDVFSSHDGRTIYVSRPSFADVVAIDLKTKDIVWRTPVGGYRADHMGISPDGTKLLVSASTANIVNQIGDVLLHGVSILPGDGSGAGGLWKRGGALMCRHIVGEVGITQTRTGADEPFALKAAEAFLDVGGVLRPALLAVVDHVQTDGELLLHDIGHCRLDSRRKCLGIEGALLLPQA
jgi:hypothetical protein